MTGNTHNSGHGAGQYSYLSAAFEYAQTRKHNIRFFFNKPPLSCFPIILNHQGVKYNKAVLCSILSAVPYRCTSGKYPFGFWKMSLPATDDFDELLRWGRYHSFPIGFPSKGMVTQHKFVFLERKVSPPPDWLHSLHLRPPAPWQLHFSQPSARLRAVRDRHFFPDGFPLETDYLPARRMLGCIARKSNANKNSHILKTQRAAAKFLWMLKTKTQSHRVALPN